MKNSILWTSIAAFAIFLGGCEKSPTDLPSAPNSTPVAVATSETRIASSSPMATQAPATMTEETVQPQTVASDKVSITAKAEFYVPYVFKVEGTPQKPTLPSLDIKLIPQGGQSQEILLAGNLRVDRAEANGQVLRLDFNEYLERLAELPPLRGRVTYMGDHIFLRFVYPGAPIDRVARLTGQLQAVTSGQSHQYKNVRYSELAKLAERDPHLKAVGFTVKPEKSEYTEGESYEMTTTSQGILVNILFTDPEGNNRYDSWDSTYPAEGGVRFKTSSITAEDDASTRISFTLHTDLKQITLPFDLKDIPVAPLEERPAPELEKTVVFVPSETNASMPDGLRMDARMDWGRATGHIFGSSDPLSVLANIEISGPNARKIETVKSVTVSKSISDRGEILLHEKHAPKGQVWHRPLIEFGRSNTSEQGRPVECQILFSVPDESLSKVQELSGEVAMLVVEEREVLVFPDLQLSGTHDLVHPTLERMDISLAYTAEPREPDGEYQHFSINLKSPDNLIYHPPSLLVGEEADVAVFYSDKEDGSRSYTLSMSKDATTARLQLEVYTKSRLETVPFRFLNLDIPPKPVEKE